MSSTCPRVAALVVALLLFSGWLALLVVMTREFMAAHGAFEHVCNGTMHIDRFLGLCAEFAPVMAVAPPSPACLYHYCSGPLNSTELAALMEPTWPCYAARNLTEDMACRAVAVLSRRNDGLGTIIVSAVGAIVCFGGVVLAIQAIVAECNKPMIKNSVLVRDYIDYRRNSWYDQPGTYKVLIRPNTTKYGA